jgi:phenylalanyl-tRNA synthetase beta chain
MLFELGNVYRRVSGDEFLEKKYLSLAAAGSIRSNWAEGARDAGFFDLKGALESVFDSLGVDAVSFRPADRKGFVPGSCATVFIGGAEAGIVGEASPAALSDLDIKAKVHYAEICLDIIAEKSILEKHFTEIPKYPPVQRDLSIVVDRAVSNEAVLSAVTEDAGNILMSVTLIDRYAGKQVPDGKISLTYRLEYRDAARTLEEKDVSGSCAAILNGLERRFGARLR